MKEKLFKPGVGVDVGTANIVVCRQKETGEFINEFHRNMLYPLDVSDESQDLLERSNYLYVQIKDKFYVVGEDALRLVNAMGRGEVLRPMQNGLLNPSLKESADLLFFIIKAITGAPVVPDEPLRFSCPGNPIDIAKDNLFHQMVLAQFFSSLGYSAKAINEGMSIAYDCNPIMKDGEEDVPVTGITCSCGAGMWNVALCYKGISLVEFSCTKSGDHLDEQVSKVTGISKNKIIKIKEKQLDLSKVDDSDRVLVALSIYYDEMIGRMLHYISNEFKTKTSEFDGPIELVLAGGAAMAPGFVDRFKKAIDEIDTGFKFSNIRLSKTPFYSVAQGACIRAQADFEKS